MNRTMIVTTTFLSAILAAAPVMAQEDACIRLNRIQSTEVVDDSTMVATDVQGGKFTIHMNGVCTGLSTPSVVPVFRTQSELDCLKRGDLVGYNLPGAPVQASPRPNADQESCFVASVSAGAQ